MGLIIIRGIFEFKQSMIDLTFIVTGIPFAIYWCYFKAKSTGLGGDQPG